MRGRGRTDGVTVDVDAGVEGAGDGRWVGIKPPGAWDIVSIVICGVLGQYGVQNVCLWLTA